MSDTEESMIGSMEEEALKRKQRLDELRNKRKNSETNQSESNAKNSIQLPKPKFRNYNPSDESLKENSLPKARPENVKDQLTDELEIAKSNDALVDDIDLTKLAPKKIDWDLKRNIAKKLDKLERKTQIAIAELIRIRLKSSKIEDLDQATEDLESANRNIDLADDDIDD
ncbi:coiled-coil domain-containing protein 12 [Dermatophagoides farinae]|uniref:Coiled-coil domain-containing protein 12 n=1 Tax=Dermatophagoides farinae TaxID=6954 RepID=A0A922I953_DERFA|nr:coiled-coil domain-containing protein 12-like [Dermatophagoides farinae]KAH7641431.1 coiled-coil domain-containing protein 12-like [Dermatophagoides farinae]KAH9527236.1 Coiled-coil domain-containing protein 12 [Dermatophagoides farinae]